MHTTLLLTLPLYAIREVKGYIGIISQSDGLYDNATCANAISSPCRYVMEIKSLVSNSCFNTVDPEYTRHTSSCMGVGRVVRPSHLLE
ncbi:hypothetical protein [Yersinia canariae]|uniref:hypothetical protein n=1 Tax=Yersinia canariae TaxID=2607663 RepID=UPI0015F2DC20|nr:hypothetical protein [Yersinia canariae]